MADKEYTLTQSGTYTVIASDSSGGFLDSTPSNAVNFTAPKRLFKVNSRVVGKLNSHYVATVNDVVVACGVAQPPKLAAPANIIVSNTIVSFDEVEGATGYKIFADGEVIGEMEVNE